MWARLAAAASRLRASLIRRRLDAETLREIEAHLELLTARNIRAGMMPEEARSAARRQFGNATLVREDIYQMNSLAWLEALAQDLRFALRMLARNPGFASVAIATLALGIGAATAIFSFVNAVVLRPLALKDSRQLVMVQPAPQTSGPFAPRSVTPGDFLDWQSQNHVFETLGAFSGGTFSVTTGG